MIKTFEYDGLNHLLRSKAVYKGESEAIVNEACKYDQDGNVTEYINNESITHYEYKNDQLVDVDGQPILYDKAGNMLNDPDGNIYTYNQLNQLVKVSKNDNLLTNYSYYADGLLSNKRTNNNTLSFYYDNGHADGISTSNSLGTSDNTSFMLSSDGSPVSSYKYNVANYYLSAANSTIGMLDESSNLTNSFKYTGYGNVNSDKVTNPEQSFLWNGEYNESDINLVYLRARFYNPKLMRFMNADTYNVSNLYNFGNGDPINNIDPSGHFVIKLAVAGLKLLLRLFQNEVAISLASNTAATLVGRATLFEANETVAEDTKTALTAANKTRIEQLITRAKELNNANIAKLKIEEKRTAQLLLQKNLEEKARNLFQENTRAKQNLAFKQRDSGIDTVRLNAYQRANRQRIRGVTLEALEDHEKKYLKFMKKLVKSYTV